MVQVKVSHCPIHRSSENKPSSQKRPQCTSMQELMRMLGLSKALTSL
jgi:hypothetical protein